MKKTITCLTLLAIMLCLAGCGSSPENSVDDFMKSIKKTDEKLLDKVYIGEEGEESIIGDIIDILNDTEMSGNFGELIKDNFLDFDYEIKEITENGDGTAVAEVEVTTENWSVVLPNCYILLTTKALTLMFDDKSEKQIKKECQEIIDEQREKTGDITSTLYLKLIEVDGEWKIDASKEASAILEAISGGIY